MEIFSSFAKSGNETAEEIKDQVKSWTVSVLNRITANYKTLCHIKNKREKKNNEVILENSRRCKTTIHKCCLTTNKYAHKLDIY